MPDTVIELSSSEDGSHFKPTNQHPIKVTPSLLDYPKSHAANFTSHVPVTSEHELLKSLKVSLQSFWFVKHKFKSAQQEWEKLPSDDTAASRGSAPRREVVIADLQEFEIYRCPVTDTRRPSELTSLHLFDIKAKNLCLDGYVRLGNVAYYVERISIEDVSIEGYGRINSPEIVAYVQTKLASKDETHDVWLRLRKPAPRYERFHTPFLWVATFGKHAIDYMDDRDEGFVGLESFKSDFHSWLLPRFERNKRFQKWHSAFRDATDFRVAFSVYVDYIYNQALNLSTSKHLISHQIWSDCMCDGRAAIESQPNLVKETLTTPHVYKCFKSMYFASKLKEVSASREVQNLQERRMHALGFAKMSSTQTSSRSSYHDTTRPSSIRVGDVVSIVPDAVDKKTWKKSAGDWLAYVQGIEPLDNGTQRLLVLWLYRPHDTNMCLSEYPIANEVFLSDNCNCGESRILSTDVKSVHRVEWNPRTLDTSKDLIIRQTYITQDSAFVTVNENHKTCSCRRAQSTSIKWRAGDTVYVNKTINGRKILEPVLIHKIDSRTKEVQVRTLLRLARDCLKLATEAGRSSIAPNELILSDKLKTLPMTRIKRACHIRFITQAEVLNDKVPSPYNRGGAGDFWFISMGLQSTDDGERLVFLETLPDRFNEAYEEPLKGKKLQGLSLFCGGGSLDRGLEEAGAVEFRTAVDYDAAAIHTQRVNCKDPAKTRLFCGSVDDYLQAVLSGSKLEVVARIGDVEVIAAGSPCPGFSTLQKNKLSSQSLIYASHITTFCTAVDLYRPLYGVLENVVNMASTREGLEDQNVLSQLVACLVSMGYQVNQYIMDSWTYGSFQRRSRIILTIAAPGLEPILQPVHTHSLSYDETAGRSLGKLPNGERFGDREHYPTPFPVVTAEEGTIDLPDIGNGNVQTCIPFPDHRLSRSTNSRDRALIECIPRQPAGYGYKNAFDMGLVPPLLQRRKKDPGSAYQRIKPNGLIPTITTDLNVQNGHNGACVHWSQHRPLSLMEARRTQGYADEEPIIGSLSERWRILGNGVDRKVSFTMGLALRKAWVKSTQGAVSSNIDDEIEHLVDVEEDTADQASKQEDTRGTASSPHSVASSSTESFSSTVEVGQMFDRAMSLDGAVSPRLNELRRLADIERRLAPTGGIFSKLSRQVSTNLGRPALPNQVKRQREDFKEEKQQLPNGLDDVGGPSKRARVERARNVVEVRIRSGRG